MTTETFINSISKHYHTVVNNKGLQITTNDTDLQSSRWVPVLRPKTIKILFGPVNFSVFFIELHINKLKNLIQISKLKFSFRGLQIYLHYNEMFSVVSFPSYHPLSLCVWYMLSDFAHTLTLPFERVINLKYLQYFVDMQSRCHNMTNVISHD
jgi:hypothetical protein